MSETSNNPGRSLLAQLEKLDAAQDRLGKRISHLARDQKVVLKGLHQGFQRLGAGAVAKLRASQEHEDERRRREVGRQAGSAAIDRTLKRARAEAAAKDREERAALERFARGVEHAEKPAKSKSKSKGKRATKRNPSHARLPARARTSHGFVL